MTIPWPPNSKQESQLLLRKGRSYLLIYSFKAKSALMHVCFDTVKMEVRLKRK